MFLQLTWPAIQGTGIDFILAALGLLATFILGAFSLFDLWLAEDREGTDEGKKYARAGLFKLVLCILCWIGGPFSAIVMLAFVGLFTLNLIVSGIAQVFGS